MNRDPELAALELETAVRRALQHNREALEAYAQKLRQREEDRMRNLQSEHVTGDNISDIPRFGYRHTTPGVDYSPSWRFYCKLVEQQRSAETDKAEITPE